MRRLLTGFAALLLAVMVLPALAAADNDKDKKDPAPDVKKDADKDKKDEPVAEKPIKVGTVSGKLTEVNESAKSIKLEITTQVSKPNYGEIQALQSCQIQLAQAAARRDYNSVANLEQQMIQHKLHLTTVEKKTKTVDYATTDDLKVRLMEPAPSFDSNGNPKKLTAKEKRELKGDPKSPDYHLPGYPGAFTDLHQGSQVIVTLVKKREAHHAEPKPKDADPDAKQENMPQASMIEILPDAPATK